MPTSSFRFAVTENCLKTCVFPKRDKGTMFNLPFEAPGTSHFGSNVNKQVPQVP